jgi:hypothetical protein
MENKNLSEAVGVVTHITPAAARAASSWVTPSVDKSKFLRLLAIVQVGTLAGNGSLTAKFQHAPGSASSLATWADIQSASCITAALGSDGNDKLQSLELRLDQNTTSQYVRLLVSNATSTWIGGAVVLGEPIYGPATDYDSADVVAPVVY